MHFYFEYLLYLAPALLLMLWAQWRVKATYQEASQQPASLSGAAAARHILDSAGLENVEIEQVPGTLSDHYDPRDKVLRLSPAVYAGRTLAAVGIAAHESGHALQDAHAYAPMQIRSLAVPAAQFGSGWGMGMMVMGVIFGFAPLLWAGILLFAAVVVFQVINLPVEFNASSRAKAQLVGLGIVPQEEMPYVNRVLNAAAWTYVAGTLQSLMILLFYLSRARR